MRVIITGGGTGGHLFPGIALATGLQQRVAGCEVMFIGTRRKLDRETLAEFDFQLESIACMGLKGMGLTHRLKSLAGLPGAVFEARRIIRKFGPDLVFGVGGYVTGPVLLAAKLLSIPTCIHEQNSVAGLANRMISRFVDRVFVSIPGKYPFPPHKTVVAGNPVRDEILAAAGEKQEKKKDELTLLVLGGSLGAHRINMLMLEAIAIIQGKSDSAVHLIHQTGIADEDRVRGGYAAAGMEAEVAPFFKDMASLYKRADLVVARAGATTLAELSVMGLPALLIPYPYAADDHQGKNGSYYVDGGGACMYRESELDEKLLASAITELLQSPGELHSMAAQMKKMGRPDATSKILDDCLKLIDVNVHNANYKQA
jgi:UDP-N-acetylglucosamine--N-acetylmuramyl-(pentapeptide) pyrophosphoryl-undecaprenol N-acetylglucosamine transferase